LRQYASVGGTFIGAYNRGARDPNIEREENKIENLLRGKAQLGLTDIVIVGGDGSMDIVGKACLKAGLNFIGIPKTIDNDLALTNRCIGFATAIEKCTEAMHDLETTARSHGRIMILEVMGKDAGHLALHSGIAGLADAILIPEIPYSLENLAAHLIKITSGERKHALVMVAEGIKNLNGETSTRSNQIGVKNYHGINEYIHAELQRLIPEVQMRSGSLGHIARGGAPNAEDKLLAMQFGAYGARLIAEGKTGRMVSYNSDGVTDVAIEDVLSKSDSHNLDEFNTKLITKDDPLVKAAIDLDIYVGEV